MKTRKESGVYVYRQWHNYGNILVLSLETCIYICSCIRVFTDVRVFIFKLFIASWTILLFPQVAAGDTETGINSLSHFVANTTNMVSGDLDLAVTILKVIVKTLENNNASQTTNTTEKQLRVSIVRKYVFTILFWPSHLGWICSETGYKQLKSSFSKRI